jgi:hypothetical protein
MPRLSVIVVRLSLLYLVAGTVIGSLLLASRGTDLPGGIWLLRPGHVEALLFGFMAQIAFGTGYWILPRTRGWSGKWPMIAAVVLLNGGLWLVALEPLTGQPLLAPAGRAAEAAAVAMFAVSVWPRVRGVVRPG